LILKEEPHEGWFSFLEALIHLPCEGPLSIRFHSKNFKPITKNGIPKMLTIRDGRSFMMRSARVTMVTGALYRLHRTTTNPLLRVVCCLELAMVYHNQGYSASVIAQALRKLAESTEHVGYSAIAEVVLKLRM
jgi:hypothetical protein